MRSLLLALVGTLLVGATAQADPCPPRLQLLSDPVMYVPYDQPVAVEFALNNPTSTVTAISLYVELDDTIACLESEFIDNTAIVAGTVYFELPAPGDYTIHIKNGDDEFFVRVYAY